MTSNRPTRRTNHLRLRRARSVCRLRTEPQRGQSASAVVEKTALDPCFRELMEQVVDQWNMEPAWKKVKANRGAPGPDGITLDEFFRDFRDQWPTSGNNC